MGHRPLKGSLSLLVALLVGLLLFTALLTVSCSFIGDTTTTVGATTTVAGATTTVSGTTTTTVAQVRHPGSFDKVSKPLQALFFWVFGSCTSPGDQLVLGDRSTYGDHPDRADSADVAADQEHARHAGPAAADQGPPGEVQERQAQVLNQKTDGVLPGEQGEPLRLVPAAPVPDAGVPRALLYAANGREHATWTCRWRLPRYLRDPSVGWLWIQDITTFDIVLMFLYIASQFVAS